MKSLDFGRYVLSSCAAASMLASCGGSQSPIGVPGATPQSYRHAAAQSPIQHLIVIVQQDRSFDNLFAGYPGANAPTTGLTSTGKRVPLRSISLKFDKVCVEGFLGGYFKTVYAGGKMDGWNLLDPKDPLCPYTRVERSETQPYWDLAKRFSLADKMFSSTRFSDFIDQFYIVAGTTRISRGTFVVGDPNNEPWGCDAPLGTVTSLLKTGRIEQDRGPFPCLTQFPSIANLLDAEHVPWRYYYGPNVEYPFNPFSAMKYVALGRDWKRNMSVPATNVLTDLANGGLTAVSWVLSPLDESDNRGNSGGPRWVSSIVSAAEKSRYWRHAAIVVVWDDSGDGSFYDNVAPPQLDAMGLGFRVPMLVVSPYAKRGYVSHRQYEFGSILKFMEENWNLGSLGATDQRANSIGDMFRLNP